MARNVIYKHSRLFFCLNILVFGIFLPNISFAKNIDQIASTAKWKKLIHFEKGLFGSQSSLVENSEFFFSPSGKYDATAELIATIDAFDRPEGKKVGRLKQDPRCAFPERLKFLELELGRKWPEANCADFNFWKKGIAGKSITLIYASSYPNNPASLFGHTFLRFDRANPNPIMDYASSFSATVPAEAGNVEYVLYGLMGHYPGLYSIAPYYVNLNEYADTESRNLWEYPLKYSDEEVDSVINHLWEMYTNAYFPYYFLKQNCAYQVLALLDVAKPEIDLVSNFKLFTIPSDTIHLLKKSNLLAGDPLLKPSAREQYQQYKKQLSSKEVSRMFALLDGESPLDAEEEKRPLDVAIKYLHYKKFKQDDLLNSDKAKLQKKLLVARAKIMGHSAWEPINYNYQSRPDLGHYSSRWQLGSGFFRGKNYLSAGLKLAIHGIEQADLGFSNNQQIDSFKFQFNYFLSENSVALSQFRLIEIISLIPISKRDFKPSWSLELGTSAPYGSDCLTCVSVDIRGGGGVAVVAFNEKVVAFMLGQIIAEWSKVYSKKMIYGPGVFSGIIFSPVNHWKINIMAKGNFDFGNNFATNKHWRLMSTINYLASQNFDITAEITKLGDKPNQYNSSLKLGYFF